MSDRASASPAPGPSSTGPVNKHAPTALERQRMQLDKLLKNPDKPVHIPKPPTEKTLRAPREMMKNVQGSSAGESSNILKSIIAYHIDHNRLLSGAGSGEFHVYKQNRRREYERLKLMDEKSKQVR